MFNFFKRTKGSKKNSKKDNNKELLKNNQELPISTPSTSQQLNSTMYLNRDANHNNQPQNSNTNSKTRNLFLNKPTTKNLSSSTSSPSSASSSSSSSTNNNNKISTSFKPLTNENLSHNFHNNDYNKYNYCQTNRAPLANKILLENENEPKINLIKKNNNNKNFENFSSRNEFVDQRKRFQYNVPADNNLATNSATNTINASTTNNDSYSTIPNYINDIKTLKNNKSDYLLYDRENINSINNSNKNYYTNNCSVVDDLSLTNNNYNNTNLSDNQIISNTNNNNIKKKSVKFFNPIDKSRDFFNNIMAKGRNNRNKNNNNNQQQQQQEQQHNKYNHQQVIMSDLPEYYPKEKQIYNSKGITTTPIYNDNYNNENFNENDFINNGYQITRSKNSPDIFKKIQNSYNNNNNNNNNNDLVDDDHVDENDQNIFLRTNLQRRGEADGSDTNITNKYSEFNSANSNIFHPYNSTTTNTNQNNDFNIERDWNTDVYEEHPPVYAKRMPSFEENNGKDIRKLKSILKKSPSPTNQIPPHQWNNNNNNNLVTKSLSNDIDHINNKKYDKKYSFLNQNHLINNDTIDKIEKLSELAECDRDNFINNHKTGIPSSKYMKMGQSQVKAPLENQYQQQQPPPRTRSRSISPPLSTNPSKCPNLFPPTTTFNTSIGNNNSSNTYQYNNDYNLPPIITEPLSPKSKDIKNNYENIPLPKITVDDFSKKSLNLNEKFSGTSPTDSDTDIYYDFDTASSSPPPTTTTTTTKSPPRYPLSSSPPTPTTFLEDIVEEDENDDDTDDWHFVSNNDIESSSTKQKESPINIKDTIFTSDMSSSTTSSSSTSSSSSQGFNKKNLKNNFIDPIDTELHDSGFISPSDSQSGKILIINSCDLINDRDDNEFTLNTNKLNTKLQQNIAITNNIFEQNINNDIFSANHILIDSISLPDVVVESKIADNIASDKLLNNLNIPEFVSGSSNQNQFNKINNNDINKSHSMGSVHFIPIHVEADEDKIQIEEIKSTKDDKLLENDDNLWTNSTSDDNHLTKEKRDLINQESNLNAKLEEAEKSAYNAEQKANELQSKINDLEIDLSTKSWNIERLEAELQSIYKEDDSVRKRLKFLEKEKENLKQKFNDKEDELNRKYENLEQQYKELEIKYQQLRTLASSLQTQLATAQTDAEECRLEKIKLCEEKDGQLKFLQENLDLARKERQEIEEKWQKEFEILRNQNQNREDNLLTDCEWKLRTMQKNCKDKIDKAEKIRNETVKRAEALDELVKSKTIDESRFKNLQAEVRQLRGLTNDQRTSLNLLHEQIEDLKAELQATIIELEHQIEEVRRMKLSCQNELEAKDRETVQKIYDATQELADIWEQKLLTEMTRLTHELETVHVEERLDDMNKLQTEHIEELKVLTTRYTENEQELSEQVAELKEQLRSKCDVAFNTRMTLDRADREYQIAMSREEEKREFAIEQIKKEFEQEKLEMDENFRVRLGEVKSEFAKELANSTEEIAKRHRQQLEQQWDQLVADKEEALQALESRHRIRIDEQEAKIRNLEVHHQRDMKDLKNAYDLDRSSLQTRDINNAQEIDQLHRKCRCLTNLFEEMRVRYERREPRQEDLREISELRSKCEAQERDLFVLTERLRDMQITMEEMSSDSTTNQKINKKSMIRKPPPKTIPTNCDVIYEENEEREQSPIESITTNNDDDDSSSEYEED